MKKHIAAKAVLAAFLALASCAAPLTPASNTAGTSRATGSLTVAIPAVAPWLAAVLPSGASGARAYLHAGKALVQIFEATGTDPALLQWVEVGAATTLTVSTASGSSEVSGTVTGIPIGRGYRVVVSIFAVATDTQPAVVGTRDDVDIWSNGSNTVYVTCVPRVPAGNVLDLSSSDLTVTAYDSGDATLGGSAEAWYAVKLKPRVHYTMDFRSTGAITAFAFGPQGNLWGNTLTNGGRYGYEFDAGEMLYFGVSGTGADGTYGISIHEEKGSLIQGSVLFPTSSQGKRYRFFLDNDTDRTNKNWRWSSGGGVNEDRQWSFWMAAVPAGTYYLWGVLEGTTPWGNINWGDSTFVPGPAPGDLETPVVAVTVDGTGTVTFPNSAFPWTPYPAP